MVTVDGRYTTAKVMIDDIEEACMSQIVKFINNPAFTKPVAIMPDCHAGKGAVVGFTMPLTDKVIPNVIGVDIGCGMLTARLADHINEDHIVSNAEYIDRKIRETVPFGNKIHSSPKFNVERMFPWHAVQNGSDSLEQLFGCGKVPKFDYDWFRMKCDQIGIHMRYACDSIGTLGGGNHFIEIGKDLNGKIWITIHSGSRNFGLKIANYWTKVAQNQDTYSLDLQMKAAVEQIKANATTPELRQRIDRDIKEARFKIYGRETKISDELAYLTNGAAVGYLSDMVFAQQYAQMNRRTMLNIILDKVFGFDTADVEEQIESVHNYIDFQDNIIRKGAIHAGINELMIIPFNMRDGILICAGKGNSEWNNSAPHGAGRVLARGNAKRTLSLDTFKEQMNGIYSTSVCYDTLDESPNAYKDAAVIEAAIEPTARVVNRIKPLINLKAL